MDSTNGENVPIGDEPNVEEIETEDEHEQRVSVLDLSWEDIMFSQLLSYLRWDDLFRLRCVCWSFKEMVDAYFKQLKHVDLSVVQCRFNGDALQVVTSNCTNIRKLIIIRAKWIQDQDIIPIFEKNKSIAFLDLSDSGCLTASCLLPLAVNCKQLRTLILRYCNWINQDAIETLTKHLDSIETVDLTCCSGINNQILQPFVQKFHGLKKLRLGSIQNMNDTSLLLIARSCPNSLRFLDVCGCRNITDRGIKMIGEYCQDLTTLHIAGSNLVTENSLCILRERGVEIDRERAGELVPYIPFYLQV